MRKDKSILHLMDRLKKWPGFFDVVEVVDYWEADLCAIGLKRENRLVYICTYPYLEEETARYDYDLEMKDEADEYFRNMKSVRGVLEKELITGIKMFLDV